MHPVAAGGNQFALGALEVRAPVGDDAVAALRARLVEISAASAVALRSLMGAGCTPLFAAERKRVRTVQALRTGGMKRGFRSTLGAAPALLVPLVLSAIRRASRLAMIVEARRLEAVMDRLAGPRGRRGRASPGTTS